MTDAQWYSAHIYYYDEQKTNLILQCIRPLFQKLNVCVERSFFVRHWSHGPHLRLRFFCSEEQFTQVIKPLIETEIHAYLSDHPSRVSLEEEHLRPLYERLAIQERELEPVLPLYPDNSIRFLPYDRRLHVLGSPLMASLLEDFYVDANDITFDMLDYIQHHHSLLMISLDLMFAVAYVISGDITNGFLSFRSHAEAFIIGCSNPKAMRALFDQKYQAQSGALTTRLRRLLTALDQGEAVFPFLLDWTRLMRTYWNRAEPLIESGELNMMPDLQGDVPRMSDVAASNLEESAFHTVLEHSPIYKKFLYRNVQFQCYRLMLSLLYLHLNRLGLRPIDRFMLCHLAANSVEEIFHIKAEETIAHFNTAMQNGLSS